MYMKKLTVTVLGIGTLLAQTYYPPSESGGGWRRSANDDEVRTQAHMDPHRLQLIAQAQSQFYGGPWAIVIVRNGYLVAEWFGMPAMPATTFDVWSCTKSATASTTPGASGHVRPRSWCRSHRTRWRSGC